MAGNLALQRLQVLSNCLRKVEYSECSVKPSIHLSERDVLIDEKVRITVKGLTEGQKVTVHSLMDDSSKLYAACGHYVANEAGEVDTFQHSSLGGTFEGVESMGLFWSMKFQNPKSPRRVFKNDVTTPFDVRVAVHDGFLKFEDLPWSKDFPCLTYCVLRRHFMAPGVRRIPVKENEIYGTLFLPPGEGPFPAAINIFGMFDGVIETQAPLLASHGIAGFSLGYLNVDNLPKTLYKLDYHYFLRAFDWLAAHPAIDENALGGLSSCLGGAYLGVMAMKRPSLKCLVCINTPYFPMGTTQIIEGEKVESNWLAPEGFRHTASVVGSRNTIFIHQDRSFPPVSIRFALLHLPCIDKRRKYKIWKHGVKVLQIHGLDDQAVNPVIGQRFRNAVPKDLRGNFTLLEYPGAGHAIDFLYMPFCPARYNRLHKFTYGGEPKPHAHAEEDCWLKIMNFLNAHLKNETKSLAASLIGQ